jgi:hypothetical protein
VADSHCRSIFLDCRKGILSALALHQVSFYGKTQGGKLVMSRELKKLFTFSVLFSICLLIAIHPTLALNEPPATGGPLPPFELAVPQNEVAKSYLGLSGSGQFSVSQIKAQAVIIEIFNMY